MEMPTYVEMIKECSKAYEAYEAGHGTEQAGADALEAAMGELYVYYTESGASKEDPDFEGWAHEMIDKYF